jgi:hypothetical protein
MNMPIFTAEASLYERGVTHRKVAKDLSPLPGIRDPILPQHGFSDLNDFGPSRIPDCGPDGILICFRHGCFCA